MSLLASHLQELSNIVGNCTLLKKAAGLPRVFLVKYLTFIRVTFRIQVDVPVACAVFPYEIAYQPESLLRDKYTNLIQFNHLPRGGHFAAFEEPALLANDVFEFVLKTEDIRKKAGKDKSNTEKKIKEPTKI